MASIIKHCDCDGWGACPHPWVVRYRTQGGRASRQREQSFGGDLHEDEDFQLKVEHDKKAHVFIDPNAGRVTFRAEAEEWLNHHLGTDNTIVGYRSVLCWHVYPAIGDRQIRAIRREDIKEIVATMTRKACLRAGSARRTWSSTPCSTRRSATRSWRSRPALPRSRRCRRSSRAPTRSSGWLSRGSCDLAKG